MEAVDVRGRFTWHQLLTRDVPGAQKFYSSLVGWKTQPWQFDSSYTVCHAADAPAAGMMAFTPEVPAEAPPHWLPYIGTRDVDSVAAAAVRAGGSIVKEPSDLKGAGRYAVLKDPQGAAFAIIDPENARPEATGMATPLGQFSWHELATSDIEAAFAFYSELFGWDALQRMDMGPVGIYLIFGKDGVQKGGMYVKTPDMPAPPSWLPYALVPSVDDAVAVIEAGGGTVVQAPMEVPGGSRIAILMDPAGAMFAINSMPVADAPAAARPKVSAKPKPKAAPAVKAKVKSKPKGAAKPKAKAKAKAKVSAKPKAKPKSKTKAKPKAKVKAKAKTRKSTSKVSRKKSGAAKKTKSTRRKK